MITMFAIIAFAFTSICSALRLWKGPTLADRVVALDVALISLMSAIAIYAGESGDTTYLNLLVVIAVIGFVATVAASRYIENEAGK